MSNQSSAPDVTFSVPVEILSAAVAAVTRLHSTGLTLAAHPVFQKHALALAVVSEFPELQRIATAMGPAFDGHDLPPAQCIRRCLGSVEYLIESQREFFDRVRAECLGPDSGGDGPGQGVANVVHFRTNASAA